MLYLNNMKQPGRLGDPLVEEPPILVSKFGSAQVEECKKSIKLEFKVKRSRGQCGWWCHSWEERLISCSKPDSDRLCYIFIYVINVNLWHLFWEWCHLCCLLLSTCGCCLHTLAGWFALKNGLPWLAMAADAIPPTGTASSITLEVSHIAWGFDRHPTATKIHVLLEAVCMMTGGLLIPLEQALGSMVLDTLW